MRRKEKEITEQSEIERILSRAQIIHLGMCDGDQPYVLPMNFGYHDGAIYLHSAKVGRKIETLRKNNKVCFNAEIDLGLIKPADEGNPCAFGMRFRSIVGFGTAEIIEDEAGVIKGLNALMSQYSDNEYTFPAKGLARTAIIKITIESMTAKSGSE